MRQIVLAFVIFTIGCAGSLPAPVEHTVDVAGITSRNASRMAEAASAAAAKTARDAQRDAARLSARLDELAARPPEIVKQVTRLVPGDAPKVASKVVSKAIGLAQGAADQANTALDAAAVAVGHVEDLRVRFEADAERARNALVMARGLKDQLEDRLASVKSGASSLKTALDDAKTAAITGGGVGFLGIILAIIALVMRRKQD